MKHTQGDDSHIQLPIIGYVRSPLLEKFATPRQSRLADTPAVIELNSPYNNPQAFMGLEQFSHIWLLWQFHQNKQNASQDFRPQIRPPRLGGNDKIGVFASRSMYRPSAIGLSVVELLSVNENNNKVSLSILGADMIDGTPIIDIKPYIKYADAVDDARSGYAMDAPMRLSVVWTDEAHHQRMQLQQNQQLTLDNIEQIEALLALDPRPAYKSDVGETGLLAYGMRYAAFNIRFCVQNTILYIQSITVG